MFVFLFSNSRDYYSRFHRQAGPLNARLMGRSFLGNYKKDEQVHNSWTQKIRRHDASNSIFVFLARLRWKKLSRARFATHSGAPHLLDSSLRCPRWIRQKVLDGWTVSRALARKHATRVSSSIFVPRVVSNALTTLVRLYSLFADTRLIILIFHNIESVDRRGKRRFFLNSLENRSHNSVFISLKIPGRNSRKQAWTSEV